MIFTGSSALNLEYNADASRRMLKKIITPLNYNQHLKLKYNIDLNHISEALEKIIFTGEIKEAINYEKEAKSTIINNINYWASLVTRTNTSESAAVRREMEERRVGKECRSRWSPYH